jgi:hypothetical protein
MASTDPHARAQVGLRAVPRVAGGTGAAYDGYVTRAEAEQRARTLQAEDAQRDTHRFIARPAPDGGWQVVKVELPKHLRHEKLTPTIEARPRPRDADDPRTGHEQRAPGPPGGVG